MFKETGSLAVGGVLLAGFVLGKGTAFAHRKIKAAVRQMPGRSLSYCA